MKIIVKARPQAKKEMVERINQPSLNLGNAKPETVVYKVLVKESPINGEANKAIVRALAKYFDITQSRVSLISGQTSRQKVFEIG